MTGPWANSSPPLGSMYPATWYRISPAADPDSTKLTSTVTHLTGGSCHTTPILSRLGSRCPDLAKAYSVNRKARSGGEHVPGREDLTIRATSGQDQNIRYCSGSTFRQVWNILILPLPFVVNQWPGLISPCPLAAPWPRREPAEASRLEPRACRQPKSRRRLEGSGLNSPCLQSTGVP